MTIPHEILSQHLAVLGKTGSGKTSTAKRAIEQVVDTGARVCILDPIKSDWWGLTSSANGKHAGLPFHILGGPRGHVPLHASAGKAIGEIVATGALPLSIIDMADFEPGGQAKFFVDFAPTMLRKMRGVVYLVIEEAHLLAPKERSGVGAENLSIHWAKTLATAGRSKGVRLILVTQRTQALHNALLGSCDTLIAHRLTAPADQEPVTKWLKANTTKEVLQEVSTSLASLKTGQAWLCSGEAKRFELVQFPRIRTYDNTATPTGDGADQVVKTAPVDQDKLRAIIGDAVKDAAANDPRELKKQIADLQRQLRTAPAADVQKRDESKTVNVLTATDRKLLADYAAAMRELHEAIAGKADALLTSIAMRAKAEIDNALATAQIDAERRRGEFEKRLEWKGLQKILAKLEGVSGPVPQSNGRDTSRGVSSALASGGRVAFGETPASRMTVARGAPSLNGHVGKAEQRILDGLAWWKSAGIENPTRHQVAFVAGYTVNGHFNNTLGALNGAGLACYPSPGLVGLTEAGDAAANRPDDATGRDALIAKVREVLKAEPQRRLFDVLVHANREMTREELASGAGYTVNGHFNNTVGSLSSLGVARYPSRGMVALGEMFEL